MALSDRIRSAGEQFSQSGLQAIPSWMMTAGIAGWLVVGIAAMLALAGWLFAASSTVSIPLLLAIVIGMIAYPLCERMTARGIPKTGAATLVLILLAVIIVGVVWLTVAGVISQWPSIQTQLQSAVDSIVAWLDSMGINAASLRTAYESARDAAASSGSAPLTSGLLASVGSALAEGVSGVFSMFFNLFIGATLLFYVLTDFPNMAAWASNHMFGLPKPIASGIVDDAVAAMRGYFRGTTITGFTVAATIGVAMLIMRVPLAGTVAVVTFLTCYIPFFGAIISGAFAFLVALGSNGFTTAVVLLVIVLIAQNLLQTVINARVMGESLNLHPIVVLVVTMLGGIFGGLLGAALGAPIAALLVNAGKRLSAALEYEDEGQLPRTLEGSAENAG